MPRPKYAITATDVVHAAEYLLPLLQTFSFALRNDGSYKTAEREFREAVEVRGKEERANSLNAWCEKYLTAKTWTKLKVSIRKRRERKSRFGQIKVITVSEKAFELVRKLSERDHVTHSDTLEFYLGKALRGKPRGH